MSRSSATRRTCSRFSSWKRSACALGETSTNQLFCAAAAIIRSWPLEIQIGGWARGYQGIFVPSTALASPGYDGQPAVYLYIAALEVNVLNCRGQGRCSGTEAVLVAVPGGSVAYVLGAVTGIESKAVIDGTSLSGAMSQDRFAFSSAHQGARRSQGAEIRELAGL
jgi:hypothetical protein